MLAWMIEETWRRSPVEFFFIEESAFAEYIDIPKIQKDQPDDI
jgi:hypothetical protein